MIAMFQVGVAWQPIINDHIIRFATVGSKFVISYERNSRSTWL